MCFLTFVGSFFCLYFKERGRGLSSVDGEMRNVWEGESMTKIYCLKILSIKVNILLLLCTICQGLGAHKNAECDACRNQRTHLWSKFSTSTFT